MILSAQTIRSYCVPNKYTHRNYEMLTPFSEREVQNGKSYGLSIAGYDIRLKDGIRLYPGEFQLGVSVERFKMPNDVMGFVKDKSSWARKGISVFNTVIEPGWEGYLTLEIVNLSKEEVLIKDGDPIAQVIFQKTDHWVEAPYTGKYQNAEQIAQEAIDEN